jgi:hypothetical protein
VPDFVRRDRECRERAGVEVLGREPRDATGRAHVIKMHNTAFDAAEGERVTVLYDKKSKLFLLLFNRDRGNIRHLPLVSIYYRLRPLVLVPLWILVPLAAGAFSPAWDTIALFATPVVYLAITLAINAGRKSRFHRELLPRILKATESERLGASRA